jgi:N-acetylglucosaminyl-diphospho-decaprenol L-rhamnosyltransferase
MDAVFSRLLIRRVYDDRLHLWHTDKRLSWGYSVLKSDAQVTVSFIVHNDYSHIQNTLENLYATAQTPCVVYLTLNTGESAQSDQIRAKFPDVRIRVNAAPQGFAANHNAIMKLAETPYVALLNDDITFQPGALDTLLEYLQAHADVGLVGPAVENPDGSPQLSTFSDPTLARMLYHISGMNRFTQHGGLVRRLLQRLRIARRLNVESLNTEPVIRDVPVVVGVAMVVRREAYLQAGLMDEHTLFYGEEIGCTAFGWCSCQRRG